MESLSNNHRLVLLMFHVHLLCLTFQFEYIESTTSDHSIHASCIDKERQALLEIKASLIDKTNRLSSWKGRDCCSWSGITCNNLTGAVQRLNLSGPFDIDFLEDFSCNDSCFGGKIHPSILNLEHLEYLDLRYNDFSGIPIPSFLGSLQNLQYLNLFDANFSGEVPPHLGNLSNLQHLYLGGDHLNINSLRWISGLVYLRTLLFYDTNMSESLDWLSSISTLSSLSSLKLRSCGLFGTLSPSVSHVNLTSLVSLDLSDNSLISSLPPWLFNLGSLEVLDLRFNNLGGRIPDMFGKLTTLTELYLMYNSFSSSLPDSLCNLTSLISMDLSSNQLEGSLPLCLRNLSSLNELSLRGNKLVGELPVEIGSLKHLIDLDLSDNYFKSTIPSSFGQLLMMQSLYLQNIQLYGSIPLSFGNLTKLESLDLSSNSLTGEMSESHFTKLKSLQYLSISENHFLVFNVSSQWIPPFQLHDLEMESVVIGIQFPDWLQTQRDIGKIILKNSSIYGTIPDWFGTTFAYLKSLDLSNNFLTGSIPSFDVNNTAYWSFHVINLARNRLTGNVPDSLCNMQSLQVISLANNQLTGTIPPCLGNLKELYVLDLANNSLSGSIPGELGNLENLLFLHLNGNKFFGALPVLLQSLTSLITLDLGNNQLRDLIPEWIGSEFSGLQYLRLQSNNFYGNISGKLCQLPSLQVLNLADNNLVGSIPPCLGNLSMMLSDKPGRTVPFDLYTESLRNIMKGSELEYSSNLEFVKSISLSGNNILDGEIPNELMDLKYLQNLNLSSNNLNGNIPERIDNLKHLESLDLSMNKLSGTIPQSLANIDALSYLNLSFNNFSGRVPSGNHFDTLNDPSIYEGNSGLCGKLLAKICPGDSPSTGNAASNQAIDDDNDKFEFLWFYSGIGPGFAVGLLGFFLVLYINKSWRHAYFRSVEYVCNRVRVAFAVKMSQFQRTFK